MIDRLKPAIGVFLLAVIIVVTMPACERATRVTTSGANSSPAPRPTITPSQTIAPRPTIAPTNAGVATVPFDLSGSGDHDTSFQSATPWKMTWSFDCTSLGQSGQFTLAVTGDQGTDRTTSGGSGMQGNGTVTNNGADKAFGLKIRSTCRWQISAVG
jgi:hypothetical protein